MVYFSCMYRGDGVSSSIYCRSGDGVSSHMYGGDGVSSFMYCRTGRDGKRACANRKYMLNKVV